MTDAKLLPIIWTLVSLIIAVLVTLIFDHARADRFRSTFAGRFAEQLARLIYFIGLPYAALLTQSISAVNLGFMGTGGSIDASILGWTSADWLRSLNVWLTLGLIALIPIGLAARQMARAGSPLGVDARSTGSIIIDSVYAEVHWTFYRTAPMILLSNAYWATLIGVILIGLEWIVSLVRNGLGSQPEDRQSWIGQILLLALSAALFILTRNVWLIIGLHVVIELALKVWTRRLASGLSRAG
jgi:hypothetical protein